MNDDISGYWAERNTTLDTRLSTTTIGDSELVISPSPFHIMSPEAITEAKLRTCRRVYVQKQYIGDRNKIHELQQHTWRKPSLRKFFSSSLNIRGNSGGNRVISKRLSCGAER
jgi:hypothetical protein